MEEGDMDKEQYPSTEGELTAKEHQEVENRVIKMVQKESFLSKKDTMLKTLETFRDEEEEMIRLKTKIINRKDYEDFLYPVVLPCTTSNIEYPY
ncbi:hypothetical protein CEXT_326021 [Caerostris extrusa]|uniref:Uncharacterized protein n=1 Tax=Caerostris extrusa TaxID=172846 RepID=A0AAV4SB05_CAEEX|nr:hypothetical protein CEXT_326021 [Caerostris extrusa]